MKKSFRQMWKNQWKQRMLSEIKMIVYFLMIYKIQSEKTKEREKSNKYLALLSFAFKPASIPLGNLHKFWDFVGLTERETAVLEA